jgi:hypothetical protein
MHSMKTHAGRRIATFRFAGRFSVADGRRMFLDYVGRPDFDPAAIMISDCRGTTEIEADFMSILAGVEGVAGALRRLGPEAMSIVLVRDELQFGMGRMLEQVVGLVCGLRMVVTADPEEAARLAGLDLATLEDLFALT